MVTPMEPVITARPEPSMVTLRVMLTDPKFPASAALIKPPAGATLSAPENVLQGLVRAPQDCVSDPVLATRSAR